MTIKISHSKIKPSHFYVYKTTPGHKDRNILYENGEVQIHQENASLKRAGIMILLPEKVESKAKALNETKWVI